MVRIKENIKTTGECIFCQKEKGKFDLLFIPPLGDGLHIVCKPCLKVLSSYQVKYPHLWDMSNFM